VRRESIAKGRGREREREGDTVEDIRYIEDNRFPFFCVFDYHVVDEINLSKDTYAECPICCS